MQFSRLAETFEAVEATTKRLEMTDLLVDLINQTSNEEIDKIVYLTIGELHPAYLGIELGIAVKLAIRSISQVLGKDEKEVERKYKQMGDLGKTVEQLLQETSQATLTKKPLTVERVYCTLDKIARAYGAGSQEEKIRLFANLLCDATPKEARYITRIVLGRMRLGVGGMTLLDAIAIAYTGGKEERAPIERAYNITSDIGYIARTLATGGIGAIKTIKVNLGRPIKPQMAERLKTLEEILEKMDGQCVAQYKYDGLRIQSHLSPQRVVLFSRRQENVTSQFPDIVRALKESVVATESILDGEAVPIDPNTGELMPFQAISQRRGRKYDIEQMAREIPVALCLFDILYKDGEDLTLHLYPERRRILRETVRTTDRIRIAEDIVSNNPQEIEAFFNKAIQDGTEGLICKSVQSDSVYEAGHRGWRWIKWKRSYRSELADTVDLVAVGAYAGRGRRAGTYGALLMAAYNPQKDEFFSVTKLGSGFTDEDLARLTELFEPHLIPKKHPRVNSKVEADFWFIPVKVFEITGDEITLSPVHTCGFAAIREGSGLAIRFPRLIKLRDDRTPEDATTVEEIIQIYKLQLKKI